MFRLKNVEVDVPGKKIKLSYVGNDSKKESRKKYDANRPAQQFSVKWKKGREMGPTKYQTLPHTTTHYQTFEYFCF